MTPVALVPAVVVVLFAPFLFATALAAFPSFPPGILFIVGGMGSIVPISSPAAFAVFLFPPSSSVFLLAVISPTAAFMIVVTVTIIIIIIATSIIAAVIVRGRRCAL